MEPLERSEYNWNGRTPDEIIDHLKQVALEAGVELTDDQAQKHYEERMADEIWVNDIYQVAVRRNEAMVHLSIKRRDKKAARDWRHFQQIKNQLVGPENEGLELYPAESRLVDGANQFHLWVLADPESIIPTGFTDVRAVSEASEESCNLSQRRFSEELDDE